MESPSSPRKRSFRAIEALAVLVLTVLGTYGVLRYSLEDGGIAMLSHDQVLVRIDHVTGELDSTDRPGVHTFIPWLEDVKILDRRPVRYVMGGELEGVDMVAPALIVRGRDGSSYSFHRVEIHAAIMPERAALGLQDHGGGREKIAQLIDAYARPILREAFGETTPREIVLPNVKQSASARAETELAAALERHAIALLEVSVSKPLFPSEYQEMIERRLVADQDTERLVQEREELEGSREQRLLEVRATGEWALLDLERELAKDLEKARREADMLEADARDKSQEKLAAATLERDAALARADVLRSHYSAEALAFESRLAELSEVGDLAIRAALVERLSTIRFEISPHRPGKDGQAQQVSTGGVQ